MRENEKVYNYLMKMKERVIDDEISLKDLKDKSVLLLFGSTGSGKSTLANALISKNDKEINLEYKDGLYYVKEGEELKYNGETIFNIGHEVKSETKAPKFHSLKKDADTQEIYLVDGPGINDSNFRNEYAN